MLFHSSWWSDPWVITYIVIFVVRPAFRLGSSIVMDSNDLHWQRESGGGTRYESYVTACRLVMVTSSVLIRAELQTCRALFSNILYTRDCGESARYLLCLLGHYHGRGQGCDGREQARCGLARVLDEELVDDDQCSHGLDDGDGTGNNAGVVPSAGGENSRGSVVLGGFLWLRDGGRRFEADPEVDVLSVGDTTLDTSAPICLGGEGPFLSLDEHVVVLAAWDFGATETGADLKRFGRGYR